MNVPKDEKRRGDYIIRFITQANPICQENIPFLQLLDTIRLIKSIPDTTTSQSCKRMLAILREYSKSDIEQIITLALKYTSMVRALLGAMIDKIGGEEQARLLWISLNPITAYNVGIDKEVLPEIQKWRIK